MPAISVIMPVFNGARYLKEAIESALAQTHKPFEIIVVDDGSTDNTAKIAAAFKENVRYVFQENQGPSAARNTGLKMAQGDYIAFLDSDDLWPENKLEIQLNYFKKNPSTEVVQGMIQCMRLTLNDKNASRFEKLAEPMVSVNLGGALIRKSVFDQVGLFDENMRFSEDVDWFMRSREQKIAVVFLQEVTLFYRWHGRNMTRPRKTREGNFIKAIKKSLERRRNAGSGLAEELPDIEVKG